MPMINPANIFSLSDLSEAINIVPNRYGRLNEMGLFPVKGHTVDTISIEEKNGVLTLIPSTTDGGPGVVGSRGRRKLRTFKIPQMVFEDHFSAKELAHARAFGKNVKETVQEMMADKLEGARSRHDITLEFLRMGALKGLIIDGDGSTVLYDLFAEFGITKKVVNFKLGTQGTKVANLCREVVRHIEDNLMGEVMTGVRALVSPEFYDALITHPNVEKAYLNWSAAQDRIGGDLRKGFPFGGIVFEEYRGKATDASGTVHRYLDEGKAIAFPTGTAQTFRTHVGPADFNETIGRVGQLYYAKVTPTRNDRGWDIHTQSNVLPLCQRPGVLVELTAS